MSEELQTTTPAVIEQSSANPYLVPGAILIAGLIIAGALFAKGGAPTPTDVAAAGGTKEIAAAVLPVTAEDHVFGPTNPDVYFIEYSDYQCVFCQRFHDTVKGVVSNNDGKVAWVYRHFPLDAIHPEARPAAVASECIAELGGNDAFWKFTDKIFEDQESMSEMRYKAIASELGLDTKAFSDCLTSGTFDQRIERDLQNGTDLGGQGTPYNVLLTKKGEVIKFSGALPADRVTVLVNRALNSLK
jgi:protein-disulfide isomerase